MGIIRAILHDIMRRGNNVVYHQEQNQAKSVAYKQTGKDIKKAKKKGTYINAKNRYQAHLKRNLQRAEENKERRDKFIDET